MEKRQLVRTFGSALAAATLSFGLFAGSALAADFTVTGDATVEVGGSVRTTVEGPGSAATLGTVGDTAVISVPVNMPNGYSSDPARVSGSMSNPDPATITLTASNGARKQRYEARAQYLLADGTTPAAYNDDIVKYIAIQVPVTNQFINGTWTVDEVRSGDTTQAVGKTFTIEQANSSTAARIDLLTSSIWVKYDANPTKKYGWDNTLGFGVYVNNVGEYDQAKATVTYDLPGTDNKTVTYSTTDSAISIVADTANPPLYQVTVNNLENRSDGLYSLGHVKYAMRFAGTPTDLTSAAPGYTTDELRRVGLWEIADFVDDSVVTATGFDAVAASIKNLANGNYSTLATGVIPMYRVYNPYTGQHLYTDAAAELIDLISQGWQAEGVAWYAPDKDTVKEATDAVYRVYNQYNGDHHYTLSKAEVLSLVAAGWTDEGVAFYSMPSTLNSAQPLYRLFNPYETVGTHHYTTGSEERDAMVNAGWVDENVAWYGINLQTWAPNVRAAD